MKILNRNAATLLLEKVKVLGSHHSQNSWRCIYMNLSDKWGRKHQALYSNFIVNAVTGLLEDSDGTIYMCDDGDIFILFQGQLKPIVEKLATHFDGIRAKQLGEQPEDPRFTIFDLGRHLGMFYTLCRAKCRHLQPANDHTAVPARIRMLESQ